jgi:hypothetical protein
MRFMMQYDPGYGDYTEERRTIFADLTIVRSSTPSIDKHSPTIRGLSLVFPSHQKVSLAL